MANRRKNEVFSNKKTRRSNTYQDRRKVHTRRKKKRKRIRRLFLIIGVFILALIIYLHHVKKPEVAIDKAVESIKNADLAEQEKIFEKLSNINEILSSSYSENDKEKDDFLKANYSNLEVKIKSQEKTERGLMVDVEISNVNFLQAFDTIKEDDPSFHRSYMNALEKENQKKYKKDARLLLKSKLTGYKIYESREFVDGILGGALESK